MTSPVTKKPLAFFADVDFDASDRDAVTKCVGALRNVGYHRNRGLGLVQCSLEESNTAVSAAVDTDFDNCECFCLTIRLDSELMLPDNDADHSGDCITGTPRISP